jgi:F-type H+-transporting ATPase subunit gamma
VEIAQQLSTKIVELLTTRGATVEIYFNDFKNTISYVNSSKVLWPLLNVKDEQELYHCQELEPIEILKMYFSVNLLSALLSSNASELSARMVAMDNATRNATTLIDKLTLNLNRSRQAMVTKELIEIISGAEAL